MALPQISIGQEILDGAMLESVEVVQELNRHWSCVVACRQTTDQRIAVEDLLGRPVEIKTTDEQGVEHIHFTGFVYDVELTYEVWGSYAAQLTAVSDSYKLDVAPHKQYYTNSTLASLASTIAGRSGLSIDANAPARKALNYAQYGETDFAFLNRVVDDYGAWLRAKPGGLEIFSSFQSGATLQWRGHDGLIEFALGGRLAPPNVSGAHYDHHAMASQTFAGVSKPPAYFDGGQWLTGPLQSSSQQLPPGFEPQRARAMTIDDYQQQLEAESERHLGGAATGRGASRSQALMAGNTLQIDGDIQARGTYGLVKVVHRWTPMGYGNEFICTPWKNYRNPRPPAARVWQGAVPARVTAHDDPKKMGRLQVQYFWQEDGVTHWARMISPHAGPERGMMFMPEVGDEVSVMFEDGDPERPVVVGSLWNGVHQAPRLGFFSPEADIPENNVKRIVTQSGNRLQMVDTPGRETMLLATPHNASLRMTEKDNATARPLVVLESAGDIVLSAPEGRVHVHSKFFSREVGTGGAAGSATPVSASAPAATPAPTLPANISEKDSDGILVGKGCQPLSIKLKPGQHLSSAQISQAWQSAYVSNSPCCQKMRAAKAPRKIVYVNGIRTDRAGQCATLQKIAALTCAPVIGVHNATDGTISDLWQSREDRSLIEKARQGKSIPTHDGRNPAVDSYTDVMTDSVRSNSPTDFWAHSQGGDIQALSAYQANNELTGAGIAKGVSDVKIVSMASAGQDYPQSLSGEHYINVRDYVPTEYGLGVNPQSDAQTVGPRQSVIRFEGTPGVTDPHVLSRQELDSMVKNGKPETDLTKYHDVNTTYLNAYKQVRGGCG